MTSQDDHAPSNVSDSERIGVSDTALIDRRRWMRNSVSMALRVAVTGGGLVGLLSLRGGVGAPQGARGALGIVRPPGALDEDDFLATCIRCTRCADACEARCIQFFGPETGTLAGTPYLLPALRGCTMCLECGPACPAGSLLPLAAKDQVAMGDAIVDERLCVSHNGTGVCGACFTACPLRGKAITQDHRNKPYVHAEACTGCGLCEEACIVRDRRAIQVSSGRVLEGFDPRQAKAVVSAETAGWTETEASAESAGWTETEASAETAGSAQPGAIAGVVGFFHRNPGGAA